MRVCNRRSPKAFLVLAAILASTWIQSAPAGGSPPGPPGADDPGLLPRTAPPARPNPSAQAAPDRAGASPAAFRCPPDSAGYGPPPAYTVAPVDRRPGNEHPGEDLLFSFAVMADSHIILMGWDDRRYMKANSISRELLANFVEDINNHVPRVDFAVHLGDVTEAAAAQEFYWASVILEDLECPLYPVVGNHDNFKSDGKQAWMDCFGLDSTHYAFDYFGIHFIVIDCTLQPYVPPYVHCHAVERAWVRQELAEHGDRPAIILGHYNMWERGWCATFDTTCHYQEYEGMAYLKDIMVEAGNVVAVLGGHVHANRAEVHDGIYYLDINATLVGRPSVRYFYVYPDRIEVDYEYISNDTLFSHVEALCPLCGYCFDPDSVCAFVDGSGADKRFTIYYERPMAAAPAGDASLFRFEVFRDREGGVRGLMQSPAVGIVEISLHDVLGRRLDRRLLYKSADDFGVDLLRELPGLAALRPGIYFVSASMGEARRTRKLPVF